MQCLQDELECLVCAQRALNKNVVLESCSNLFFIGKDALLTEFLLHPFFLSALCICVNFLYCLETPRNKGHLVMNIILSGCLLYIFLCSFEV